ncbi:uncharacterized protein LOC119092575 [Pollicipes pollicipes]|uniref:uncharacterized protein LOC119092575 n=1 Tax=Pollicipes pollicipes TaxID=41117 RepID=UPI0018849FAD|nr:uncharacterized protein LOC119092575 [Pollicipes pollicipes]
MVAAGKAGMVRWRSEYRRTHRGVPPDQLLAVWQANLAERRQLRSVMMASHFDLGSCATSSSNSSSDDELPPSPLRLRHLALTSPKRQPAAVDAKGVRFGSVPAPEDGRSRSAARPGSVAAHDPKQATPAETSASGAEPSSDGAGNGDHGRTNVSTSVDVPPTGRGRRRSRSRSQRRPHTASPFVAFGQGERGCDAAARRTFNVLAPPPERWTEAMLRDRSREAL